MWNKTLTLVYSSWHTEEGEPSNVAYQVWFSTAAE